MRFRNLFSSVYAFATAAISTGWLNFLGSSDYEERPTFGYLFGDQAPTTQAGHINNDFGRAEFLQVPLFDFRSLLGVRLPVAGSWTQNPIVFLREITPESVFYLWRTFLPTFVMLWTLNKAVDELCGRGRYAWRTHVVTICALGHVGLFSRTTDWTVAAGFNSAVTTLSCTILLNVIEMSRNEKSTSRWIVPVAMYSTIEIATSHPGWLFYAVLMVSSVWLVAYGTLRTRIGLNRFQVTWRTLQIPALVFCTLTVNAIVTFLDLSHSLQGIPSSAISQGMSGSAETISTLAGFSRGALPGWAERLTSEFVIGAFAPLFWVGFSFYQPSTVLLYAANLFPRVWFPLLTAPVILIAAHVANRFRYSRDAITGVFVVPSLVMITYTLLQEWGLLAPVLKTSGTWIPSGSLRTFLVLGLLSTFSKIPSGCSRALRAYCSISVALAMLYSVIMLGLLPIPPGNGNTSSIRSQAHTPHGPSSFEVGQSLLPGGRIVAASSEDSSQSALFFLELRTAGYQVVAPTFIKTRSLQPVANLPATLGLFIPTPIQLEDSMSRNQGRTFDFLNVEAVFIAQDSMKPDLDQRLSLHNAGVEVTSAGVSYQTLLNSTFSTFYIASTGSKLFPACSLLHDRCDALAGANRGPARSTPRFQLCKLKCLATFDFDFPESDDERMILLPVGFDPAIKVSFEDSSQELRVEDVGGLLGVHVANSTSGTLHVEVRPDSLMLGRIFVTYLNSLLLLSSLLFAILRFKPHLTLLRRRT